MPDLFILDSYALLAYLGDEQGRERVEELLRQAKSKHIQLYLCTINLGELLYITERKRGLTSAQKVQALIETLPITLVEASRNLVLDAAHIKANYPISYADAFVAALAKRENATVLTGDPEFKTLTGTIKIEWLS